MVVQFPVNSSVVNTANGLLGLDGSGLVGDSQIPSTICRSSDYYSKSDVDTSFGDYFKKDGSVQASGAFDMNSHKLIHVSNPTADQDVATKYYVDHASSSVSASNVTFDNTGTPYTSTNVENALSEVAVMATSGLSITMTNVKLSVGHASTTGGTYTEITSNLQGVANYQYAEASISQIGKFTNVFIAIHLRCGNGFDWWNSYSSSDLFILSGLPPAVHAIFGGYVYNQFMVATCKATGGFQGKIAGSGGINSVEYIFDYATGQISLRNNDDDFRMSQLDSSGAGGDLRCNINFSYVAS